MKAIYPGSFDPITNGHLDIIKRSVNLFDELIVVVMENDGKPRAFSPEERMDMIRKTIGTLDAKVRVDYYAGLIVDYCAMKNIYTIVRGLRALSDFDFEFQFALTNRKLNDKVDCVFLMTSGEYSYVSSSTVRTIASHGGDTSFMVTNYVAEKLKEKFRKGEVK
jgi:pantetheine-phosphate adenylyltransferase